MIYAIWLVSVELDGCPDSCTWMINGSYFTVDCSRSAIYDKQGFAGRGHHVLTKKTWNQIDDVVDHVILKNIKKLKVLRIETKLKNCDFFNFLNIPVRIRDGAKFCTVLIWHILHLFDLYQKLDTSIDVRITIGIRLRIIQGRKLQNNFFNRNRYFGEKKFHAKIIDHTIIYESFLNFFALLILYDCGKSILRKNVKLDSLQFVSNFSNPCPHIIFFGK